MQVLKSIPIFYSDKLPQIKEFYTKNFGFVVTVDSPGFVGFKHSKNEKIELSFEARENLCSGGLLLQFEVADANSEHERLKSLGVSIDQPISDKPWGDRSFIVKDPAGVSLYISSPIAPAPEYRQYFK